MFLHNQCELVFGLWNSQHLSPYQVRLKIVKNVQLLEQVNKEIKSNEQLKNRLRNLKEIEALQKEVKL